MSRSPSYKQSTCCGSQDCVLLDVNPDQPCWGQVWGNIIEDPDKPKDFVGYHACQGHINYPSPVYLEEPKPTEEVPNA